MSMSIKTIEEYYREQEYAIPFELLLLSKHNETQEKYLERRNNNIRLLIAFRDLNEKEKTYS